MKLGNKYQNPISNLKANKNKRNSIQDNDGFFGKELRFLVVERQVPELICMLGCVIKNYGILCQGLFRISGNKTRMDELRTQYCQSRRIEIGIEDIHNVTGLFKSFLREVPGGVIPCPQSLDLIKATKVYKREENLDLLTNELFKLPVPHYNLLKFTCSLLNQVCRYSANNLMTSENLGTVFGPTFFSSVDDLSVLPIANHASTILIQNYNDLFKMTAPVHTNLNQALENSQHFDDFNIDCYTTKGFAGNNATMQFGESSLVFNSNGDTGSTLFPYSIQDEDPMLFPDIRESFDANNPPPSNSPFSNSLDTALRMCLTNHLFSQAQGDEFDDDEPVCTTRLISDVMLNPPITQVQDSVSNMKQSPSNWQMKNIGKRKTIDDPCASSLPRREISSNVLQNYLSNHNNERKGSDTVMKSDPSQTIDDALMKNDANVEKHVHAVPQLDLSTLYDTPKSEKSRSPLESKNQEVIKNKFTLPVENPSSSNFEPRVSNAELSLSQINRNMTNIKRQLRQFEDEYYRTNGVRLDKYSKADNEWFSRSIFELNLLRQEKEKLVYGNEKIDESESESGKNSKKKFIGAAGDMTDSKFDSRPTGSRPISALSEIAVKVTPSSEVAKGSALDCIDCKVPDLSQTELENLKIALGKISNHLMAERARDNRPNDLDAMTQAQIEREKVAMQKALLNFETTYGRKQSPDAVCLMRPLYDRYRQVKKRLCQLNEIQESKIVQRTLDSHSKQEVCQSAWSSERPVAQGLQSLNRNKAALVATRNTSQFDIEEEVISHGQRPPDSSKEGKYSENQLPRRNVRTFQYRQASADLYPELDNNKRHTLQKDDIKSELQQLEMEKRELQKILKDFENNFERDTKRKMEKMDRQVMDREYCRYRTIKTRIKELKDSLEVALS